QPAVVPSVIFPTADGWLFVMCITPKFWEALCEGLGRPDLSTEKRFAGFEERFANRDALAEILDKEFARATTAEWMNRLAGTVPVAPVLTLQQAIDNPYFHATGGVLGFAHPQKSDFRMIASPIRIDGQRPDGRPAAAPGL